MSPVALIGAVLMAGTLPATSPPGEPGEGPVPLSPARPVRLQADLVGRANPPGLMAIVAGAYRRRLGMPASAGWPAPYLEAGVALGMNPAEGQASAYLEWMQAAFLVLRIQGDLFAYLGQRGALLQFPDPHVPFGDRALQALAGRELARFGKRLLLQPTLRAKVGRLIARNQTDVAWYRFGSGGPYFYELEYDTLLRDGDGLAANRTAVLAELWSSGPDAVLLAGPFYELQRTFAAGLRRDRVGAALYACPAGRLAGLDRPRLYLQAGVNLRDPNRQGELFVAGGVGADLDF